MTESKGFLRRVVDTLVETRRIAAQRRVDAYLKAIGLLDEHDRRR